MATDSIRRLWDAGLPLAEAAWHFATPEMQDHISQLRQAEFKSPLPPPYEAPADEKVAALFKLANSVLQHNSARFESRQKTRDRLCSLLLEGYLASYGYVVPRAADDPPRPIPRDIWAGAIDWDQSSVAGNGLSFVAVRVSGVSAVSASLRPDQRQPILPPPGRGRPPVAKLGIVEAYRALKALQKIEYSAPISAMCPAIRAWLAEKYPSNAGFYENLRYETIRKAVGSLFKNDKSKRIN